MLFLNKGFCFLFLLLSLFSCQSKKEQIEKPREDKKAKQMLQGIWINEDSEEIVFRAFGDTIYYPDSLSRPVRFEIRRDTLYMGEDEGSKYLILKQTPHLFVFKNQTGEVIKLRLGEESENDISLFQPTKAVSVNQNKKVKTDTILSYNNKRYHSYTQVNPSSYKVYCGSYNDNGVRVERLYFDNIVYIGIFEGNIKRYSHNFYKQEFLKYLPAKYQKSGILSDISLEKIDINGFHYYASICLPEDNVCYMVGIDISYNWQVSLKKLD